MEVGTYVDGRSITYDEPTTAFAVGGTPVTFDMMRAYSAAGQVTWSSDAMSEWADGVLGAETSLRHTAASAPSTSAPGPEKKGWFTRLPLWGKILFIFVWPVALGYGIWAMWKDRKFSLGWRIAITGVTAIFLIAAFGSSASQNTTANTASTTQPTKQQTSVNPTASASSTAETVAAPDPAPAPAPTPAPAADPAAAPAPTSAAKPAPAPAPKASYDKISARQFQKLVKDPDSHVGETYLIYGEVTQFDSATGDDSFRADTGATKQKPSYGYVSYDANSWMTGDASRFTDVVEKDLFIAKVTVVGSYSYDTQIGGNTTVPQFQVDQIKVYGHVK